MARALCSRLGAIAVFVVAILMSLGGAWAASDDPGGSEQTEGDFDRARSALEEGDYRTATGHLERVLELEPDNPDALNLLGYSYRKLGDKASALSYYQKAIGIEPEHRGANEYLGELYLESGNLAKAEERLRVLDKACFFPCDEYTELKQAIKDYKKRNGLN